MDERNEVQERSDDVQSRAVVPATSYCTHGMLHGTCFICKAGARNKWPLTPRVSARPDDSDQREDPGGS